MESKSKTALILIERYLKREFGKLSSKINANEPIPIGYTDQFDGLFGDEFAVQVYVDLDKCRIITEFHGEYESKQSTPVYDQYNSLDELIDCELVDMDFVELVYRHVYDEELLLKHYYCKTTKEK